MRQPDDPGVDRPAWSDPDIDPLDPPGPFDPDPFYNLKRQVWVRVYLVLAFLFVLALVAMCGSSVYPPGVLEQWRAS